MLRRGFEPNNCRFFVQVSNPMTEMLEGRDSWVSRARAGYEANVSRLLAQTSNPMTAISGGRNSWVSRAQVGQVDTETQQGTIRVLRLLKVVVGLVSVGPGFTVFTMMPLSINASPRLAVN